MAINEASPWRGTPPKTVVAFLLAVFFVFTTFGFANDIIALGRQQTLRLALAILLTGLFAVFYAVTGISLRGRFWKAFLPAFALEFVVMGLLGRSFPDAPQPVSMGQAQLSSLQHRLLFDAVATMTVVCLGYACFIYASVRESRRHIHVRTEMALLENEMAAARQVQQAIVPDPGKSFPGYSVESVYKPARQVGGDFFQILPVDKGGLLIVFGDVAGKGLPAAMLVSMLVGSIRTTVEHTHDPAVILGTLHDRLLGRTSGGFCTAVAASIADDGRVAIASAGHLSPYLDGHEVELPGTLPLGITGGGHYEIKSLEVQPGSRLTFISDGVVEAQNQTGELFGFDRAKAASRQPAAAIAEAAIAFGQADDITVVTIERLPIQQSL